MRYLCIGIVGTLCLFALIGLGEGELKREHVVLVEQFVKYGKQVNDALKNQNFHEGLKNFANAAGPFFSVAGPIASMILTFMPKGDSPELAFMKQEFAKIDQNFREIKYAIAEVKNLIIWNTFRDTMAKYELSVSIFKDKFDDYMKATTNSSKELFKKDFLYYRLHGYDDAAKNMYHFMTRTYVFAGNFNQGVAEYHANDRSLVQKTLKAIMNLIVEGVRLEILCLHTENVDSQDLETTWKKNIEHLIVVAGEVDIQVMNTWHSQSYSDIKKYVDLNHKHIDQTTSSRRQKHEVMSDRLYQMLSRKFYWRHWMVIVYESFRGGSKHYMTYTGGHTLFQENGYNFAVSSADKSSSNFNYNAAMNFLNYIDMLTSTKDAQSVHNVAMRHASNLSFGGTSFTYVGFICWGCTVNAKAAGGHLAYKAFSPDLNAFAFG